MTTILGEALLTKTLVGLCEGGQCGGEVTLTTDEVLVAYAVVTPDPGTPYIEQDCDAVKTPEGAIVVSCAAVIPEADQFCDGTATFTKADLNAAAWSVANDSARRLMTRMDRA